MPKHQPVLLASLAALALAGCSRAGSQAPAPAESLVPLPTEQPAPPASPSAAPIERIAPATSEPPADDCGADKIKTYLRQLPTTEVIDRIRAAIGHERIRTIKPGDAVTMDFRPDRLNIEIGEDGRIKLLRCG